MRRGDKVRVVLVIAGLTIAAILFNQLHIGHLHGKGDHAQTVLPESPVSKVLRDTDKPVAQDNHIASPAIGHEQAARQGPDSANRIDSTPAYIPNPHFSDLRDDALLSDMGQEYVMEIFGEHPIYKEQVFQVQGTSQSRVFGAGEYIHDQTIEGSLWDPLVEGSRRDKFGDQLGCGLLMKKPPRETINLKPGQIFKITEVKKELDREGQYTFLIFGEDPILHSLVCSSHDSASFSLLIRDLGHSLGDWFRIRKARP
jgi:hypothetical protein